MGALLHKGCAKLRHLYTAASFVKSMKLGNLHRRSRDELLRRVLLRFTDMPVGFRIAHITPAKTIAVRLLCSRLRPQAFNGVWKRVEELWRAHRANITSMATCTNEYTFTSLVHSVK